jgi:hypothetical protein
MRGTLVIGFAAMLAAACGQSSPAAPSSPPTTPAPPSVPGAPPKAVLSVGVEGTIPTLTIANHELAFDASRSTGDGLTYVLEFGDGASTTQPFSRHASAPPVSRRTARLTVTDRFGRTDATTQDYFIANVDNSGCCATSWYHAFPYRNGTSPTLSLTLYQQGSALTGTYRGLDLVRHAVTGTITRDRAITLRTADGTIELTGGLAWKQPPREYMTPYDVAIRLTIKGGDLDGQVFDFSWHDPF